MPGHEQYGGEKGRTRHADEPAGCVRFGRRIRELGKHRGCRQVYLAEHTGLGMVHISQLEHGKDEPGLRTIEILAISRFSAPMLLSKCVAKWEGLSTLGICGWVAIGLDSNDWLTAGP